MWDIVWVSPQGHRSVSVSRHFGFVYSADADACNVAGVSCNVAGLSCNVARVSCNAARVSCNIARVSCNVPRVSFNHRVFLVMLHVFCLMCTCFL